MRFVALHRPVEYWLGRHFVKRRGGLKVNPGRKPTAIGGDGILPYVMVTAGLEPAWYRESPVNGAGTNRAKCVMHPTLHKLRQRREQRPRISYNRSGCFRPGS